MKNKKHIQVCSGRFLASLEKKSGEKHLRHCLRFAETFPDIQIVSTLWIQLSWSRVRLSAYFDDEPKREFYTEKVADYLTQLPDKHLLEQKL